MYAMVSVLDDKYSEKVQNIWDGLETEFGVLPDYVDPIPHFSYSVAESYDLDFLKSSLPKLVEEKAKLYIKTTNGLGIFTRPKKVIYIPLIRNLELSNFQKKLWEQVEDKAVGLVNYYHPDKWVPHISLAGTGLTNGNLPEIIKFLSHLDYDWDFTVRSISIICEECIDDKSNSFHLGFIRNFSDKYPQITQIEQIKEKNLRKSAKSVDESKFSTKKSDELITFISVYSHDLWQKI